MTEGRVPTAGGVRGTETSEGREDTSVADSSPLVQVVGPVERRVTEKLFKLVDEDGSGFVDFGEFISSARSLSRQVAAHEKALNPEADAAV